MPAAGLTLSGGRKRWRSARPWPSSHSSSFWTSVVAGLNPTEADQTVQLILSIRDSGVTTLIVEHIMRVIMGSAIASWCSITEASSLREPLRRWARDPQVIEAYLGESK